MALFARKRFLRCLLIFAIAQLGFSQDKIPNTTLFYGCGDLAVGVFRQVTNSHWLPAVEGLRLRQDEDIKEGRWTLSEFEKLDPAYVVVVSRGEKSVDTPTCPAKPVAMGELVSPLGKTFIFEHAVYDIEKRKLTFRTVRREGIFYEGEVQYAASAKGRERPKPAAHAKIRAVLEGLGEALLEFDIDDYRSLAP